MNILIYQVVQKRHIRKANVINTINMAQGFNQNNLNVFFYISDKSNLDFYKNNLKSVNFVIQLNNDLLLDYLTENNINIVYCRDYAFPKYLIQNNYQGYIILEDHNDQKPEYLDIYEKYDKFILTTISPIIMKNYNISKKILLPCSINFKYFSNKNIFKDNLFDNDKVNITYCGSLYGYKGIPLIIEAANKLLNYNFNLIGGSDDLINLYKKNASPNVKFYGLKEYHEIPNYLYSSDILLIPYNKRGNVWSKSNITSPIKLFEYLSTKKPVLCSDIKGIKNWVSEKEVTFFKASNLNDFCEKVNNIVENINSNLYLEKGKNGYKKAEYYSTKNKCKKILELISV